LICPFNIASAVDAPTLWLPGNYIAYPIVRVDSEVTAIVVSGRSGRGPQSKGLAFDFFQSGYAAARMLLLCPRPRELIRGIFIADGLLFSAFIKMLVTRTFMWRGRKLSIGKTGELEDCCEK
jgi:hypothetical protein